MRRILLPAAALLISLLGTSRAIALEGGYLGATVGSVNMVNKHAQYASALGVGLDVGFRVNSMVDLMVRGQWHEHDAPTPLSIISATVSADFRLFELSDIEFLIGGGPGFYKFKAGAQETKFGLNFGGGVNLRVDDNVRIGIQFRYHAVSDPTVGDKYHTVLMNVGYLFGE